MIQSQQEAAKSLQSAVNWAIDTNPTILKRIHAPNVNIAIYERNISALASEIEHLLEQSIEFRSSGDIQTIMDEITKALNPKQSSLIIQDIKTLLHHFEEVANAKQFRLLLATINTNMCIFEARPPVWGSQ